MEEANINHSNRQPVSLFKSIRPSIQQSDILNSIAFGCTDIPTVKSMKPQKGYQFSNFGARKQSFDPKPTMSINDTDLGETSRSFSLKKPVTGIANTKDLGNAPVIHMQFDMAASDALG